MGKINDMSHGYSVHAIDGARDFLLFINKNGIEIDVAIEELSEIALELHRQIGRATYDQRRMERVEAKKTGTEETPEVEVQEPPELTVIGLCPKCGSPLGGYPLPGCESSKTGRVFYKECRGCTYYSELYKRRNNYIEIEGGE